MMRLNLILIVACWGFGVQAQLLVDIKSLSSTEMQGRETGSPGAARARNYIADRYAKLQLGAFNAVYQQPFTYGFQQKKTGVNLVGYLRGCTYPEHYVVVTAHYDHLGTQGRTVFHGADDNASGVAAMLELAARLSDNCPVYSYLLIATDAEENGLFGAKAFVDSPPVPLSNIVLNVNLDMIAHPDRRGKLYLTGANRYPALIAQLKPELTPLKFLHHRGPARKLRDRQRYDWPNASDHGPFYRAGIPYLFFGGQVHRYYHTPDDTWQRLDPQFVQLAMQAIWQTVQWIELQPPTALRPESS